MESVLECLPQGSRVAILRLRSLGDCVLTTPALDILKRFRPDLRLAVMVEDRFRAIFEGNRDIEAMLPPELGALRRWSPRLCLNLHGGARSAWMTALSGARYRAAFGHFRHQFFYNVRIPRAQEIFRVDRKVHTAEHIASAVFYLGAPRCDIPRAKLVSEPRPHLSGPRPYSRFGEPGSGLVLIHPFASAPDKTWSADNFLAIAEHLKSSDPVFIGGPADDLSPFQAFRTISDAPLEEIKLLFATAALFIGNDSGPAHMAAAFGVPVVAIFGASDPAVWGPWRTASEVVTAPGGIAQVEISQVVDALARLRVPA